MKSTFLLIWLFAAVIRISCEAQTGTGQSADTIRVQMKNLPTVYGPATSVRTRIDPGISGLCAYGSGAYCYYSTAFVHYCVLLALPAAESTK